MSSKCQCVWARPASVWEEMALQATFFSPSSPFFLFFSSSTWREIEWPLSLPSAPSVYVRECVCVCLRASVKETESTMQRGRIFEYKDLICRHSWRKLDVSASANKRPRWSCCLQLYEENTPFDSGERVPHTAESEVRFKDWWKNVLFREAFCEFLQGFCMLFFESTCFPSWRIPSSKLIQP